MSLPATDLKAIFNLEPKAAIAYLQHKGYKLTGNWQAMLDDAHARAFTIAKAVRLDVVQDIRNALDRALRQGQTLKDFQKNVKPTLQAKGWWGKQIIVDGAGNAEVARLGSPWRLATIYRTNLQSAFMAANYQEMAEATDSHPYWQYVAVLDGRTRPSHRAMNGRVFRHDDPVWNTIWPPNGFNCRCRVRPRSERSLARDGIAWQSSAGKLRTVTVDAGTDKRTGEITQARRTGIAVVDADGNKHFFAPDAGFDFNPGRSWSQPFTPPPQDTLPKTFAPGQVLPALPKPERFDPARLLPAGLSEREYFARFRDAFPGEVAKTGVFMDVMGEPLPITEDLFKDAKGQWKILKNGRERYLLMLADTLQNPDEIWLAWQPVRSGGQALRRRMIKVFALESEPLPGLAVFEEGRDGWTATTLFQITENAIKAGGYSSVRDYIDAQRGRFLLYRRK
jgi:SPP1 gp7 family putative phage head morphogenesis protein